MLYVRTVSSSNVQRLIFILLHSLFLLSGTHANTEKIVFETGSTSFIDLDVPIIRPSPTIGRLIHTLDTPFGNITERTFRLDGLKVHQKYEVRICWPAIMPTKFTLAIVTPESYEESTIIKGEGQMILHLQAESDFISPRTEINNSVPQVTFEIILDPLMMDFIPTSLTGIIYLIIITAIGGYFLIGPIVLSLIERNIRGKRLKIVRIKT